MKIDFHVHGSLSSKLPFDLTFFLKLIARARTVGLDALALTDHFHAKDFEHIRYLLDQNYPYSGDSYLVEGIKVYPGIEVEVSEGLHLLIIGGREAITALYHRLEGHFFPPAYCSTPELLEKQAGLNTLAIIAHPFRPGREISRLAPEYYAGFQAIDLNARDLFFLGNDLRDKMQALSARHNLPVVAGSDTHHYYQLGAVHNQFNLPLGSIDDLKTLIAAGEYSIFIDQDLPAKITQAREAKQVIKAQKLGASRSVNEPDRA